MLKNSSTIEYKHQEFIQRVVDMRMVWWLQFDGEFAMYESNEYENAEVIPFWSDKAGARAVAKEGWEHYMPISMPLAEFLENCLVGMHNNGLVVGTNWNLNNIGKEFEPLELALEIAEQIEMKGIDLELTTYKNISDFHIQVKRAAGLA